MVRLWWRLEDISVDLVYVTGTQVSELGYVILHTGTASLWFDGSQPSVRGFLGTAPKKASRVRFFDMVA